MSAPAAASPLVIDDARDHNLIVEVNFAAKRNRNDDHLQSLAIRSAEDPKDRKTLDLVNPVSLRLSEIGADFKRIRRSKGPKKPICDISTRLFRLEQEARSLGGIRDRLDSIKKELAKICKSNRI